MPLKILPPEVSRVISSRLDPKRLYELRFRADMPIAVNYGGKYYYLAKNGLCDEPSGALVSSSEAVKSIVVKATEFSLYSVNNQLIKGFITIDGGVRIGVCGEIVSENGEVRTIKNFTSVNVRIPHEIADCSLTACSFVADARLRSSLIVAPPGAGKTTVLRDLCVKLCKKGVKNLLLVDERCEIAAVFGGRPQLGVGSNTDVISNCSKDYAFSYGIRSMRPDVIVTDELCGERDYAAVIGAIAGGVTVIASAHASSPDDLFSRAGFRDAFAVKAFSRYVFLSDRNGPGTYENVYDAEMKCVYYAS